MNRHAKSHIEVLHPSLFMQEEKQLIGRINDWLASHLAILFGLVWTIWVFFAYPLVLLFLPQDVQNRGFFLSSGWVQLWALPLFVFVGNKLQRSTDAQSDAMTKALTHIAIIGDQNALLINSMNTLLDKNTKLTQEIHKLVDQDKGN